MKEQMIGIVENGRFRPLAPKKGAPARLTRIAMQAAQSPESGEVKLTKYEGQAILVEGHNSGSWIYSAKIGDTAGLILTAVVRKVYGSSTRSR